MIQTSVKSRQNEDICVLAAPNNHPYNYLFDCGSASLLTVGDVIRTKGVFVTHTHIDHFANFDFILRSKAGSIDPLIVTGPQGIARNVQGKLHAYTWNLIRSPNSYFEVREIVGPQEFEVYRMSPPQWKKQFICKMQGPCIFDLSQVRVDYAVLDHKIPSIAYRMKEADSVNIQDFPYQPGPWIAKLKEAWFKQDSALEIQIEDQIFKASDLFQYLQNKPGYSIGYAMDHLGRGRNHEILASFFKDLDELYIESFFRQVDLDFALKHYHSTSHASGTLARQASIKRLKLVHHSRRYLGEIPDLIEEGMAAFEGREPKYRQKPKARFVESESESEG